MANLNKQSTQNPFDLAHTFEFKLRLVAQETVEKIEEDRMPKLPEPSDEEEEELPGLAEVEEMLEMREIDDDSRLDDMSDLKLNRDIDDDDVDNGEKAVNKSVPLLEKGNEILGEPPAK